MTKQPPRPTATNMIRTRYQLILGLLFAVFLPALARELGTGVGIEQSSQYNTVIGACLAIILGHIVFRRLSLFPGITSGSYVITTITVAFALVLATLLFFRIDYSRFQLLASYVLSLAFFIYIQLRFASRRGLVLGVIPTGNVDNLPDLGRVSWHPIPSPDAALPHLNGVIVDLHADHSDEWNVLITKFVLSGIPVYHVKEAIEQLIGRVEIDHLSENSLGSLNPNDVYLKTKGIADMILALFLLVALLPVMLIVAVMIRLNSPGPALFKQQRTGFRARPFTVYKFRTMRVIDPRDVADPENSRRSAMTQTNDSRITSLGAFLRKSRLDELPQLVNILKGEMSLIGPRPEAVVLTQWYEKEIAFYHYRHIIKPGLTGWAQINQGHVAEVDQVREKLHYDFYYVKNFSVWLDLLIVLRTIQTMITGHGAR